MKSWGQGVEVCGRLRFREGILIAASVAQSVRSKGVRFAGVRPQGHGPREVTERRIRRNGSPIDKCEPASGEPFRETGVERDRPVGEHDGPCERRDGLRASWVLEIDEKAQGTGEARASGC